GMAEVFLAKTDGPMGFEKQLVIKRILPHLAEDPQFVDMFLGEAKLAAQLNHPNLVQLFDFGEAEGAYFIAMEYIDGPTLRLLLARARDLRSPITLGLAARIVSLAAEGLAYAHDFCDRVTAQPLHLVPRDVSPDNILVGRSGAVKLVDFGIAKARGQSHHPQAGTVKGKVAYMAPEQLRGEPLDRRVDLYALGVVLYELCTGRMPFDADTDASMVRAVLYDAAIPAVRRVPTLPPAIQSILDRLLAKNRAARYPDCRTLHADPEAFIPATGEAPNRFALPRPGGPRAPPPAAGSARPAHASARRAAAARGDRPRLRADVEQPHPPQRATSGSARGRRCGAPGDPRPRPHGALGAPTYPSAGGRARGSPRCGRRCGAGSVRVRLPHRAGEGTGPGDPGADRARSRGAAHAHHRDRAPGTGRRSRAR